MPPCHSDDWFRDDPVTLKFRTFVQFLREEVAYLPLDMNKEACSKEACRRPTWGWSWQMKKAKESQRNGTIFLIIACLKSALPTNFSVKWANKLRLLLKLAWIEFYIVCTWKCSWNFCCLLLESVFGYMSVFLVIWGTMLGGSIFVE